MIPSLPTDTLFKFLAVGGLFLAGFSYWFSHYRAEQLRLAEAIARHQYIEFMDEVEAGVNAMAAKLKTKQKLTVGLAMPMQDGRLEAIKPGTQYPMLRDGEDRDDYRKVLLFWDNWLASALPRSQGA